MDSERRQTDRIKYPDDDMPMLLIKLKEGEVKKYKVTDISEKGMGLKGEDLSGLQPKSRINGQITFSDGESIDVEGEVSRVTDNHVAIHLRKGIPLPRIMMEQILLED